MAGRLQFYRGDTVDIPFTLTGVDLTGMTVFFTVKASGDVDTDDTSDSAALIAVETSSHTDPTNGETVLHLTSTDTNVTPGDYVYDVQTKDGSGNIQTRVAKPQDIRILGDVTRRTT